MKKLLLIRHAKSSWDDTSIDDVDRPLNGRGKKNAPDMALRLVKKDIIPDLLISSHALRALETARLFAKEMDIKTKDILVKKELYMAGPSSFEQVIQDIPDEYDTIALFSHNPGITEFANSISDARIDNMPTASVFAVKIDTDSWRTMKDKDIDFWFFDYPKSKNP